MRDLYLLCCKNKEREGCLWSFTLNTDEPAPRKEAQGWCFWMGLQRVSSAAFTIGSKGYMGCGDNLSAENDPWSFDPASATWARVADFAGGSGYDLIAYSIGNRGYVGTGNDRKLKDFWQFNPR